PLGAVVALALPARGGVTAFRAGPAARGRNTRGSGPQTLSGRISTQRISIQRAVEKISGALACHARFPQTRTSGRNADDVLAPLPVLARPWDDRCTVLPPPSRTTRGPRRAGRRHRR